MSSGSAQNLTGDEYSKGAATKTRNSHHLNGASEAANVAKKFGATTTLNSKIGAALETAGEGQGIGGSNALKKATTISSSLRLQVGHSDRNYHGKLQKLNALHP